MTNKITKREMFNMVMEVVEGCSAENKADMIAFLEHEVELLNRKSSKASQTKTQKENEILMDQLEIALAEFTEPVTISDFMKISTHEVATLSNQKLSALLKKLEENRKTVVKTVEKKRAYFSLVRE